jgi:hypothetical protein
MAHASEAVGRACGSMRCAAQKKPSKHELERIAWYVEACSKGDNPPCGMMCWTREAVQLFNMTSGEVGRRASYAEVCERGRSCIHAIRTEVERVAGASPPIDRLFSGIEYGWLHASHTFTVDRVSPANAAAVVVCFMLDNQHVSCISEAVAACIRRTAEEFAQGALGAAPALAREQQCALRALCTITHSAVIGSERAEGLLLPLCMQPGADGPRIESVCDELARAALGVAGAPQGSDLAKHTRVQSDDISPGTNTLWRHLQILQDRVRFDDTC